MSAPLDRLPRVRSCSTNGIVHRILALADAGSYSLFGLTLDTRPVDRLSPIPVGRSGRLYDEEGRQAACFCPKTLGQAGVHREGETMSVL